MESKEEILTRINNFLDQSVIFESQILAFEKKVLRQLKSKEIKAFFIEKITAIKSCVKNGLYVSPKKSDVYKDKINRPIHSINKGNNKKIGFKTQKFKKKDMSFKILNNEELRHVKKNLNRQKKLIDLKKNIVRLTVRELAYKLNISSLYLISIFEQSKIIKKPYDSIENIDYQIIEYFIISRFITLKKADKKKLLINKQEHKKRGSFTNSAGVYGQIAKFGLGKLIFIKSK
jgi:hypothetical protein